VKTVVITDYSSKLLGIESKTKQASTLKIRETSDKSNTIKPQEARKIIAKTNIKAHGLSDYLTACK
jgi:hypothetical protein